jgi:hypothetical protein
MIKVTVAWAIVLVWLLFGAGSLYLLEHGEEKSRAQYHCDKKSGVIANFTAGLSCTWEDVQGQGLFGDLAVTTLQTSCHDYVDVVEDIATVDSQVSICRPPTCKIKLVTVDNVTVSHQVPSDYNWRFPGAFFFCLTTISTIGYGNYVPVTAGGKAFTIVYSIFGVAFYTFANFALW